MKNFRDIPSWNFASDSNDILKGITQDSLVLTDLPGGNTSKYQIPDYPHLLIRRNEGYVLEEVESVARVFNALPAYGINSLPYIPLEIDGSAYVATYRVTGEDLEDVIDENTSDELVQQIDELWANLGMYYKDRKEVDRPRADDIFSPHQYMLGSIASESEKRIWLVDLGEYADYFNKRLMGYGYEAEIFQLAGAILGLQDRLKQTLPLSQSALRNALSIIDPSLQEKAWDLFTRGITPLSLVEEYR